MFFWARKSICTTFCFEFFFCLGVRRPQKIGQIPQNCQKSNCCRSKSEKKFKTKSCTYAFSSSEKQILVKKNFFLKIFFQIFFNFFSKKWEKSKRRHQIFLIFIFSGPHIPIGIICSGISLRRDDSIFVALVEPCCHYSICKSSECTHSWGMVAGFAYQYCNCIHL